MIVFDLECLPHRHRFEGWFGSSGDFAAQQDRGLLSCPACGSSDVAKAVMAPAVGRKGNQAVSNPIMTPAREQTTPSSPVSNHPLPPEAVKMMQTLAKMQAEVIKDSRWVGDRFAEDARAMHYGERSTEAIHGRASLAQAKELAEEGIALAPLPFPVAPPDETN